jgi:lysophospholipase L1-like esterase
MIAFGLLLPLALLEVGLRLVDPFSFAEVVERERFGDAVLWRDGDVLRLRPGARGAYLGHEAVINADGLRNPDVPRPKPADVFRILVVGDSVAFGWGVAEADAFPRVLERQLAGSRPGGRRIEVVNAGSPGWGMAHYAEFLRSRGLGYEPDVVVVTLINNDLTDVIEAQDEGRPPSRATLPFWLRVAYVGRAVEHGIRMIGPRPPHDDFFVELAMAPDKVARAVTAVCSLLGVIEDLCGPVPLVVLDTIGTTSGARLEGFVACAERLGVPRVEAFLAGDDYRERFAVSVTDLHPNAAGHLVLAEALRAFLEREILR